MNPIGIVLVYYLSKLMINIIITIIGVILDLGPLYFYNIIKNKYNENNIIYIITTIIMLFTLYPYIIMMECITLFYKLCHV